MLSPSNRQCRTDQDVLIAFGPYVRSGDADAARIHQEYLSSGLQRDFIRCARRFLVEVERGGPKPKADGGEAAAVANGGGAGGDVKPAAGAFDGGAPTASNNAVPLPQSYMPQNSPAPTVQSAVSNGTGQPIGGAPRLPPGLAPPPGMGPPPGMMGGGGGGMGPVPPRQQLPSALRPSPPGMPPPMRPPQSAASGGVPAAANTPPPPPPGMMPASSSILPARSPPPPQSAPEEAGAAAAASKPTKVRRTQTRCEEQPGRLFANEMPASAFSNGRDTSISVRPRSELTARWILPLPYLRNRALRRFEEQKSRALASGGVAPPPQNLTIRDALSDLAVGLFRRGVSDGGSQSSIVSKEILAESAAGGNASGGRPNEDYYFNIDQRTDSVFGTVPFYAPRTPGNVVFRLYFEDEPHVTLATGPCIHVVPSDGDVESVLRFILSNFKSNKKSNGSSSMNSLASVLELFSPRRSEGVERLFDQAGRLAWGCICESRKVVEKAGEAHARKRAELEEKIEAERIKEDLPDLSSLVVDDAGGSEAASSANGKSDGEEKDAASDAKAKWTSELFNNERKWREIQVVYASVLKVCVCISDLVLPVWYSSSDRIC